MSSPKPPGPGANQSVPRGPLADAAGSLQRFTLRRPEASYAGTFCAVAADAYPALQPRAHEILHSDELRYFLPLPAERRRVSFLLGRYAAKKALAPHLGDPEFAAIGVAPGVFQNPVVCYPVAFPWAVSISHSDTMVCALAFPMVHPMALDIEAIDPGKVEAMMTHCLDSERAEAGRIGLEAPAFAALLWTAKEALSKILHTGLMCPFEVFEVQSVAPVDRDEFEGLYRNFAQYKFHSWLRSDCVLTLAMPKRTHLQFESGPLCLPAA